MIPYSAPVPPNLPAPYEKHTSGLAIASLILGILSVIGAAFLLIPPVLAVIFGHVAVAKCAKDKNLDGRGLAIAGFVMGYVGIFFALVIFPAMAIPAFAKVKEASNEKAIHNNIRQLSAAADQYYLEMGKTSASLADLVGPGKYIKQITPVAGETYPDVYKMNAPIIVNTKTGKAVRYDP